MIFNTYVHRSQVISDCKVKAVDNVKLFFYTITNLKLYWTFTTMIVQIQHYHFTRFVCYLLTHSMNVSLVMMPICGSDNE